MELKRALRKQLRKARSGLSPEERREKSERICGTILSLPAWQRAETVMIYQAVPGEVELDFLRAENESLPEEQRKHLLYPRCEKDGEMEAVLPADPNPESDAWTSGSFGIREPDPEQGSVIPPEKIDLVICPCVGFDGNCRRLGMGGGYYDRFLPRCRGAEIIAVAFEVQRLPEVPSEEWDVPIHGVVTERTVERRKR